MFSSNFSFFCCSSEAADLEDNKQEDVRIIQVQPSPNQGPLYLAPMSSPKSDFNQNASQFPSHAYEIRYMVFPEALLPEDILYNNVGNDPGIEDIRDTLLKVFPGIDNSKVINSYLAGIPKKDLFESLEDIKHKNNNPYFAYVRLSLPTLLLNTDMIKLEMYHVTGILDHDGQAFGNDDQEILTGINLINLQNRSPSLSPR